MKYITYTILLVLTFALFFAGINEPSDVTTVHYPPRIILKHRYINGDKLVVEPIVVSGCYISEKIKEEGCGCDYKYNSYPVEENIELSFKIFNEEGSLVDTYSETKFFIGFRHLFHIEITLPDTTGKYFIEMTATEEGKGLSSDIYKNSIVAGEGINGTFALKHYYLKCHSNAAIYPYDEGTQLSGNLTVDETDFSLAMMWLPNEGLSCNDIQTSSIDFDESGNFTIDYESKIITISYDDGSSVISQNFYYVYDGVNLILTLITENGGYRKLYFEKQ